MMAAAMKRMMDAVKCSAVMYAAAVLAPVSAFAAEEGHHAPATITSLVWPTANFLIYAYFMGRIYKKFLRPALLARSAAFEQHVKKAAQVLEDAERDFRAVEARMHAIEEEQRSIKERLATEGAQIAAQVLAQSQQSAATIRRDIGRRVERELAIANNEVKQRIIVLATEEARKMLQATLSDEDDFRLRQDAVRGLL